MDRPAILALEDRRTFRGRAFGAPVDALGEVVFNTSMTGYQEVLTDPSYRGQIVAMTYPLIGNYGVNEEDVESHRPWVEGFVVRERSRIRSNWRSTQDLADYLADHGIPGIEGVDTRALTKHIREAGAMRAALCTTHADPDRAVEAAKGGLGLVGRDLVKDVSCTEPWDWGPDAARPDAPLVCVLDYGVKYSILRQLAARGLRVRVVPAAATADAVLAHEPSGVLLSNGPGDPAPCGYAVETVRALLEADPGGAPLPLFGICMGHHMLFQALGGTTEKLKFGHHGANHPVKDLRTGEVAITTQNHGFVGDPETLGRRADEVETTHLNLNDMTLEGIRHRERPAGAVQFHPEAGPGPHDARVLFDRFAEQIRTRHA